MKFGVRKVNIKNRIRTRTTGKIKRKTKKMVNPFYGKKGVGYLKDPKKAVYNKVYNKTTVSKDKLFKSTGNWLADIFIFPIMFVYYCYKYLFYAIIWGIKKFISLFNKKDE